MNKMKLCAGVAIVPFVIGSIFILSSCSPSKAPAQKAPAGQKGLPANLPKKALSKGMGGLTVKIVNSKKAPLSLLVKAFRSVDSKTSTLEATFQTNSMRELVPGVYDIEVASNPQRIYKGIRVSEGKELVEDLGCLTGSFSVKAMNSKKKAASYTVKILNAGTKTVAGTSVANRSFELSPGIYDIEIGIAPILVKKNVRIDASKDVVIDIGGMTGDLLVRYVDENKKDRRVAVKVKKAGSNEIVAVGVTNKPIEIVEGLYDLEIASTPAQSNKGVSVKQGAETVVEAAVSSASIPASQASGKPVLNMPLKKK